MNNHQIRKILNSHPKTRNIFVSVHAADTLPEKPRFRKPCAYICNTDVASGPGKHWVCFFFPRENIGEYYDSYGHAPSEEFARFLGFPYRWNGVSVQSDYSTACGQHVIYYIFKRSCEISMDGIVHNFHPRNRKMNDDLVNEAVESAFGVDLNVFDVGFVMKQVSTTLKKRSV